MFDTIFSNTIQRLFCTKKKFLILIRLRFWMANLRNTQYTIHIGKNKPLTQRKLKTYNESYDKYVEAMRSQISFYSNSDTQLCPKQGSILILQSTMTFTIYLILLF